MRLSRLVLALPVALCAACPGADKDGEVYDTGIASGDAEACLSGAADAGGDTLALSATVVSDEASQLACSRAGGRVLTLSDAGGNAWTLGYALWELGGVEATPALDLAAGDSVTLLVRREDGGEPFGFALTDATSIVAALSVGRGGAALQGGDVPDLTVADGAQLARASMQCGQLLSDELVFSGDADITLTPYEDRLVTAGAAAYTAYALRNTRYESPEEACAEAHDDEIWALWR